MGEGVGCSQKPDVLFGLAQGRRVELALCSVLGVSRTRTKERGIASGCTISLPRPPKPNRSRGDHREQRRRSGEPWETRGCAGGPCCRLAGSLPRASGRPAEGAPPRQADSVGAWAGRPFRGPPAGFLSLHIFPLERIKLCARKDAKRVQDSSRESSRSSFSSPFGTDSGAEAMTSTASPPLVVTLVFSPSLR